MLNGSKRKRGQDEYVFIDGRAVRQDEVIRIDLGDTLVPGQAEAQKIEKSHASANKGGEGSSTPAAAAAPASASATPGKQPASKKRPGKSARPKPMREALSDLEQEDAFAITEGAASGEITMQHTEKLLREDRRILRTKCLIVGAVILITALCALCVDSTRPGEFFTPLQVIKSIGAWFTLLPSRLFSPEMYQRTFNQISLDMPYYASVMVQAWIVVKYAICGILLALSGMLYQNTFRNPIAAPSMLGVSNGINIAILVLVLQFGVYAVSYSDLYYLYSTIGGIAVLLLVLVGGKWISGPGRFNVVNMILMGTIISQLLGILITYAQAYLLDDAEWLVYYQLQNATSSTTSIWMYLTLFVGGIAAIVPVFIFRFKLNLISFSDEESRLLGVDPSKLRVLALVCGSVMILVAQMNTGQVAMASLIIPFVVRAVFGSEFRKQLIGNVLIGALVLLICGLLGQTILFEGESVGVGAVVSIVAIPLFVWMLAIRQKSWE